MTSSEVKVKAGGDGSVPLTTRKVKGQVQPKLLSLVETLRSGIGAKAAAQKRLSLSRHQASGVLPATPSDDRSTLLLSHEQTQHLRLQLVDYPRPKRLWANLMYGKTARMSTLSYFSVGMAVGCILALISRLAYIFIELASSSA